MAFQATPNGIKVEMNFFQNGIPVVNVFHVHAGSAITTAVLNDVIDIFSAYWDAIRVHLVSTLVLDNITATDISVANGIQSIDLPTATPAGAITALNAAANAACCISLRTAFTGRSFRGRSYVGGLPADALDAAQTLDAGFASAMAGHLTDLMDALTTAGHFLAVLSRYANLVLRVTGLLTEIVSVIVDTKVDSQRRRTAN